MKRYLITTADERSWKFDRPVLFLGEWCRRYDRKHIWSKMDAVVAEPYGLGAAQKARDLDYVQLVTEQLLVELTSILNAVHHTQHNQRYWNIVLGHWLRRYVAMAFNRYHVLEQALMSYEITGTTVFQAQEYSLATMDSLSFIWACNDDQWNHIVFSNVLNYKNEITLNVDPEPLKGLQGFSSIKQKITNSTRSIKNSLKDLAGGASLRCLRNTDAFIISSYLPVREVIKLQLSLGQLPQLWRSQDFMRVKPDAKFRLDLKITSTPYQGFEDFVRVQLMDVIPGCYLEGYNLLLNKTKSLRWPNNPKFIFTSNNFDTDEVFKVWAGTKVNQGIPYFVGQHGNNYGTLLGIPKSPELTTPDKFITWGWCDESEKTIPAFIFKTVCQKQGLFDQYGGLLLIGFPLPHWLGPTDNYYEFGEYQNEQFKFVDLLPTDVRQQLTIRLHHNYKNLSWCDEQRWQDHDATIKLELGVEPIDKLIVKSRLVVHSYDSTGILETLFLNIPTICFWRHGFDHLLSDAKPYYQLLKNVGILNDTPEQAANIIVMHWDNLGAWWNSSEVQEARRAFCNQYAKTEKQPVKMLKRLFKSEMVNRRTGDIQ